LHDVALAQTKPPGHGVGTPALHVPAPLHEPAGVSTPFVHEATPQLVPAEGNTHAPVALQSLAPHVPPAGLQVVAQQCVPAPDGPHTPLTHWSFAPHVMPVPSFGAQAPAEQ
jgi:hypothetical protein